MSKTSEQLREQILEVIATVESRGLYVHSTDLLIRYNDGSSKKSSTKSTRLPLIVSTCVLNALVPRSAMLLVGGHGGGKTTLIKLLGRMMTGRSLKEIESGVLRGHPQLTEEKMIATLRPGPLMKDGLEVVVWRSFVTGFWKVLDEVNRLTPHTQNILLSMLAEGELKYYDEIKRCEEFCLFATMNPSDAGTFDMAPPFLDRFGIAVPITMPSIDDLELILASRDEKLFGYDELWQVPALLTEEDLLTIWNLSDKIPVNQQASEFMRAVVREFGACIRVDKSQSEGLNPETGLCDNCHFNTAKSVCNKVLIPLSVRAAKDLNRYCKAAAWLVGAPEVSIEIVKSLAPLVFWHRTRFVREDVERTPYYGNRYRFTINLVEMAASRFAQREPAMKIMEQLRKGDAPSTGMDELREMAKSDLIVGLDYTQFAKELKKVRYSKMVKSIDQAIKKENVRELSTIRETLLHDPEFPNRNVLLNQVTEALHKLTQSQFRFTFEQWQDLWTTISLAFPKLTPLLKETLDPPKRKIVRSEDITLLVYVTGGSPTSPVFLEVSGGEPAIKLREEIEKNLAM
ncbi:MAG: MoxR family ATPase [Candidatus Thorarchaeota archaeon]